MEEKKDKRGGPAKNDSAEDIRPGSGSPSEGECRCKEVSKKTLPEMIKLMVDDLAFWKKRS